MARHRAGAPDGEAGVTLIELLLTVFIMGTSMLAVLFGISVTMRVSQDHRKLTNAEIVAIAYGESLKAAPSQPLNPVQYGQPYKACAIPSGISTAYGSLHYPDKTTHTPGGSNPIDAGFTGNQRYYTYQITKVELWQDGARTAANDGQGAWLTVPLPTNPANPSALPPNWKSSPPGDHICQTAGATPIRDDGAQRLTIQTVDFQDPTKTATYVIVKRDASGDQLPTTSTTTGTGP